MEVAMFWVFLVVGAYSPGLSLKHNNRVARVIESSEVMDVTDFSVYYDVKTNETIKKMLPRPWYKPGWKLRLPFTGGPCACDGYSCECCTGIRINLSAINFDRRTCAKLQFDPEESTINMEVVMSNSTIYKNTFSARNPPPFCIPIPVPYLPPGLVDLCVRLFDITVIDQKLHVCMDMDTRIDMAPVLVLHFDCMDMGSGGVSLSKPGGVSPAAEGSSTEPPQNDSDVYDPVTEAVEPTTELFNNSIKYI